jgi:hypothetical protein
MRRADAAVGYRRPPVPTRFNKGRSGNPNCCAAFFPFSLFFLAPAPPRSTLFRTRSSPCPALPSFPVLTTRGRRVRSGSRWSLARPTDISRLANTREKNPAALAYAAPRRCSGEREPGNWERGAGKWAPRKLKLSGNREKYRELPYS